MPRAPLVILMTSSSLAFLAFMVFQGLPEATGGARHWASSPLLSFSILFAMGVLVLASTLRRPVRTGRSARFK